MNGTEKTNFPLFMQDVTLPEDYYKQQDPYSIAPSCKVKVGAMAEYARKHGKKCWDLTKEEFAMFVVN